jgi:DNA polymerase-3 subunit alpha
MSYAHLHLHTHFSLLDGANKIGDLMKRVARLGMPAAAMTDHGNMFGAVEFYKSAVANSVKPVLGCEVYVAPRSRKDKSTAVVSDDYERGGNYHLILLAADIEGYRNLSRMVSQSYIDGFYYKPRIDKELLREFHKGIICLSGCLGGEVANAVLADRYDVARRVIEEYSTLFGDRYYLEMQDNHLPQQAKVNEFLRQVAPEVGVPLVATNDCHYLEEGDHEAHEVLLCVQTGKRLADENRWRFDTNQLYVKDARHMLEAFKDCESAIHTSVEIADRCDVELSFGKHQFPVYEAPSGRNLEEYLRECARVGLDERLETLLAKDPQLDVALYRARLETELATIISTGFAGYFLIVSDFVNYAKDQGIPVGPGRGSAAGSLVSYSLRITDIDPIRYNLLFERFLNPERVTMPDIDVDFCYERRDDVVRYVREKYGRDRVANIITFGTLKGKAAIRDVGRVLDFSFAETDRICKLYPAPKQGRDFTLAQALDMEPKLRELRDGGEREERLFRYAAKLEGLARHVSKHAAGIVISDTPLVEQVPLFIDKDGTVMTQFAGPDIEALGLIKFDFLGLKTLTLIADTVRRIEQTTGQKIDITTLPLDAAAAYRLVAQADTVGIFQMESSGMQNLLTQIKPSCFEDLIAVLALFRPGPLDSGMVDIYIKRRDGKEPVRFPDEKLRGILAETYGVIVYQEQVMQIAQVLSGFTLGQADNLRRVMGKKKVEAMAAEKQGFLDGAVALKHDRARVEEIFQQIETFAAYGFNKSHSAAYALVSYQTAWLKAFYPREFLAALLTMEMGQTDKVYKNLADARRHGIRVLPPDVNTSHADFTVCDEGIRFGLAAVKGVGEKAIEALVEVRREGPFRSLADFCARTSGSTQIHRRMIESLIRCGAFDSFGIERSRLMSGLDAALAWAVRVSDDRAAGQFGLFALDTTTSSPEPEYPEVPAWEPALRLEAEHECVGFYISGHPLDGYLADLTLLGVTSTQALDIRMNEQTVKLAGMVNTVRRKNSKKGERYATFNIEDREGILEVIAWPNCYKACEAAILAREPVLVTGRVEFGERRAPTAPQPDNEDGSAAFAMTPQLIADEVVLLSEARRKHARIVDLEVRSDAIDPARLELLRSALRRHPGRCRSYLKVVRTGATETFIELPGDLNVDPTDRFLRDVEDVLGPGAACIR